VPFFALLFFGFFASCRGLSLFAIVHLRPGLRGPTP
jgi:hypothetical protein